MTAAPEWAAGLPIAAKARNGERFAKIEPPRPAEPAPARQSDANATPDPEILQQNSQTPPWEANGSSTMFEFEQQQENAAGGNGRFNGYPHGESEPPGARATTTFIYRSPDGAPYLQVRKFVVIDQDGSRKKSFPQ